MRAVASLAEGRHEEAAHDLAAIFRLRAAIRSEPALLSHLIVVICDDLLLQPVWEGLAERRWTAAELVEIQAALRRDDLLAECARALRGDRAMMDRTSENVRRTVDWWEMFSAQDNNLGDQTSTRAFSPAMNLGPRGWIDANEANLCQGYQRMITVAMEVKAHRVWPEQIRAMDDERNEGNRAFSPTKTLARIVLPVMGDILRRVAADPDCLRTSGSRLRAGALPP